MNEKNRRKNNDRRKKNSNIPTNNRKNVRRKEDLDNKLAYYLVVGFIAFVLTGLGLISYNFGYNL